MQERPPDLEKLKGQARETYEGSWQKPGPNERYQQAATAFRNPEISLSLSAAAAGEQ